MSQQKQTYYTNSYSLSSMIQAQQHIPRRYKTSDYFGGCMRIQEQQTASFLQDFVDGIIIVLPKHYDLLQNLLFVSRLSGYKPIRKLLPLARKKYDIMLRALRERQAAAATVKPVNLNENKISKYSILESKKKMLMMSCTDLCTLGDAINTERNLNVIRPKDKFNSFVSYRIELVLSGKMPIDADFDVLLKKYGTQAQKNLYTKIINNQVKKHRPLQPQIPQQSQKKKQPSRQQKPKKSQPVVEPTQEKTEKSGPGFFQKIGQSVKNVFNKVKKPLLVGGIFALSIFGGKKAMDVIEDNSTQPTVNTEYAVNYQPNQNVVSETPAPNVEKQNSTVINNDTITNPVFKKSVQRLQQLKETNPTDRNMDVNATANRLYQHFGSDTYNVILTCATAPYKLNDLTKFDIKPTTHNMIEYLCNNNLSAAQRSTLETFVASHIAMMNYERQIQLQHQR